MPSDLTRFSQSITLFHERRTPEAGYSVGYAALIHAYELDVPLPDRLALISLRHKNYETEGWLIFTPRHQPEDSLMGHLTFALKYEGVDLAVLKKIFKYVGPQEIESIITTEPTGQYSRRIWFLFEWLMGTHLELPDLATGNYIDVLDTSMQFGSTAKPSRRHRVRNNLPGVREFCPLVRKTDLLKEFLDLGLSEQMKKITGKIHLDMMARAAAFLLLKDSKASYAIEGERPPQNRAQRWGRAIGQAGSQAIDKDELLRLQELVLADTRFTAMGLRTQEGFIGEHDRRMGTPIPDHISASWQDLPSLVQGLIETDQRLEQDESFDPVIAAAIISFGFVFIHPFADGNGRIHRYLMHHVLLRKKFVSKGIIFPVSAVMLNDLTEYRKVLESYSQSRIDHIRWKPTADNNIEILNKTIDLYRYFDATKQAEYLYRCVRHTVEETIPEEVIYLERYDLIKGYLEEHFEMPYKTVALLIRFLEQNKGRFSERAKENEFNALSAKEISAIEERFIEIFLPDLIS